MTNTRKPIRDSITQLQNNDPELTSLDFNYHNKIDTKYCMQILQALAFNQTVTSLTLSSHKEIFKNQLNLLVDVIKNNNTLTTINFSRNKLSRKESKHIAKALATNKTIKTLILAENKIDRKGIHYLLDALRKNATLELLDLSKQYVKLATFKDEFYIPWEQRKAGDPPDEIPYCAKSSRLAIHQSEKKLLKMLQDNKTLVTFIVPSTFISTCPLRLSRTRAAVITTIDQPGIYVHHDGIWPYVGDIPTHDNLKKHVQLSLPGFEKQPDRFLELPSMVKKIKYFHRIVAQLKENAQYQVLRQEEKTESESDFTVCSLTENEPTHSLQGVRFFANAKKTKVTQMAEVEQAPRAAYRNRK